MKIYILVCICLLFAMSCATSPKSGPAPSSPSTRGIDVDALKQELGMSRPIEDLGYDEKVFDSCKSEFYPETNCGKKRLVVIHFRLQCRDSVGTVDSVSNIELMPVRAHHIRWRVGYFAGSTGTNSEGYGQIYFVAPGSSKRQRLSFQIDENSLGVTASEVSRIIVPRDWCE